MSQHLKPGTAHVTDAFGALMFSLAETFGTRVTAGRVKSYAIALGDLPLATVQTAALRAMKEHTYATIPTPGELRRYVQPPVEEAALIAWAGLTRAAGRVGGWASLAVEDQSAAKALLAVFSGWGDFCEQCGESPTWHQRRNEYVAAYKAASRAIGDAPGVGVIELLAGRCGAPSDWADAPLLTRGGEIEPNGRKAMMGATNGEAIEGSPDRRRRLVSADGGASGAGEPATGDAAGDR